MNLHRSSRVRFWAVLVMMLGLTATASAAFFSLTAPNRPLPNLRSYSQSAADYYIWLDKNADAALEDTTGARCREDQPFVGTWYLAGSELETPVTRSCSIPFGRTLLIPVLSIAIGAAERDSPEQKTVEFVRARTRDFIKDAKNLSLTIDGTPVPNITSYYEESVPFAVTGSNPTVDAGYYVAVSNLLPGNHKISWHAESVNCGDQDITYNLRVGLLPF